MRAHHASIARQLDAEASRRTSELDLAQRDRGGSLRVVLVAALLLRTVDGRDCRGRGELLEGELAAVQLADKGAEVAPAVGQALVRDDIRPCVGNTRGAEGEEDGPVNGRLR